VYTPLLRGPREVLLKGKKAQYLLKLTRVTPFDNANIVYFFTKQATLIRRSTILRGESIISLFKKPQNRGCFNTASFIEKSVAKILI
jgi:hypothetical protein